MYTKKALLLLAVTFLFTGCTTTATLTNDPDDMLLYSMENSDAAISFDYASDVPSGEVKPMGQNYEERSDLRNTYSMDEPGTLKEMTEAYIQNKFASVAPGADTEITVTLREFETQEYNPEGKTSAVLKGLAGGNVRYSAGAKIVGEVVVKKAGAEPQSKVIVATSEDEYENVQGGIEKAVNEANNKFLMLANKFIENQGL